jgi:aspartate carbamoyltransferase catalytic subunit
MGIYNNGLIDIHHLNPDQILNILELSGTLKKALLEKDLKTYQLGAGKDLLVALLFYENSTRTRSSFEIAALRLGLKLTGFGSIEGSSVKKGESLAHTLDMFEAYMCDAVILRHPLDGSAKHASERIDIPVFNAGDGKRQHPTQTILDLFTIMEHHKKIEGLHIGLGGDLKYGRTAHTLALALSLFKNNTLHLYSPENLPMPQSIVLLARERGTQVIIHDDLGKMVPQLDIFYQTRIQRERMPDPLEFEKAKKAGIFTTTMMETTKKGFGLMHPLPIDKNMPGILPQLDNHPKSIYKKQAGNGVPTRMAQLALALGLVPQVEEKSVIIEEKSKFYTVLEINKKPIRTGVSIRPIRQHGVVIDHLRPYSERILAKLLKVSENKNVYRSATVRSVARPQNIKGMLMIEDRELTEEELHLIATVSPGARVNRITDSSVTQKLKLSLPHIIEGIDSLLCPNEGCITRPSHIENVSPRYEKIGEDIIACSYCNFVMTSSELFSHLN